VVVRLWPSVREAHLVASPCVQARLKHAHFSLQQQQRQQQQLGGAARRAIRVFGFDNNSNVEKNGFFLLILRTKIENFKILSSWSMRSFHFLVLLYSPVIDVHPKTKRNHRRRVERNFANKIFQRL